MPPVQPMLAKSVSGVPDPAKHGGLSFEPKWDGFRVLAAWDGESVELGSRGAKPLTRYFPELVEALPRVLPEPCLIDGEIVMIDSTCVRVHQHGATGKKGDREIVAWDVPEEASRARSMPSLMLRVVPSLCD